MELQGSLTVRTPESQGTRELQISLVVGVGIVGEGRGAASPAVLRHCSTALRQSRDLETIFLYRKYAFEEK